MIDSESNKGLSCPNCGSVRLQTKETRGFGQMTRRNKACRNCKTRFFTLELPEIFFPDDSRLDTLFESEKHVSKDQNRLLFPQRSRKSRVCLRADESGRSDPRSDH